MNPLAIAIYITAGCHTALVLLMMAQRPPWWVVISSVVLWPMLIPAILIVALGDWLDARKWMPLVVLAILASPMGATEWGVDGTWYDISDSHHGKHALGGAALGATGYALASLGTPSRPWRYAWAVGATAAAAAAYEAARAGGGTLADPADIAWTTAGGLAGAVIADLTGQAITLVTTPDVVAAGVAWRW